MVCFLCNAVMYYIPVVWLSTTAIIPLWMHIVATGAAIIFLLWMLIMASVVALLWIDEVATVVFSDSGGYQTLTGTQDQEFQIHIHLLYSCMLLPSLLYPQHQLKCVSKRWKHHNENYAKFWIEATWNIQTLMTVTFTLWFVTTRRCIQLQFLYIWIHLTIIVLLYEMWSWLSIETIILLYIDALIAVT